MNTIEVKLSQNSYNIKVGPGLLEKLGKEMVQAGFKGKTVVITNPVVNMHYGATVLESLERSGFKVSIIQVPEGENQKSLEWAGILYEQLAEIQAERSTPILAFGGGVIGDLAGFVAATYMRGVPFIQIPTTLLAQVDASIGGKVAVNHGKLKNMIGAFYQPLAVISDTSTLKTLPTKEIENGLAEVIKYGITYDSKYFEVIESNINKIKSQKQNILEKVIIRSVEIKAEIVGQDEKDLGLRNILNFGHTIGHALEAVSDFKLSHGMGVGLGMLAESIISNRMNRLQESDLYRIRKVIYAAGLPVQIPALDIDHILQALQHDKKKATGKIKMILPSKIGVVFSEENVSQIMIEEVLRELS